MAYSTIQNIDRDEAKHSTDALRKRLLNTGAENDTYQQGKLGEGNGEHILLLGATGYIGKALAPELDARNYKPVVLSRSAENGALKEFAGAEVVTGDVNKLEDLKKVFKQYAIKGVITLLSSRNPADADECYQVDYQCNHNALTLAAEYGVDHFVHVSDYGCYRPELLPQVYKLQIEGELIGQHMGKLNYSIVRPTAYFPYIAMNYSDIKHGEKYRLFDHGEYNLFNPIAREDLSEFLVNLLFKEGNYGRIFPVGGPWNEENVHTIKSAGEVMFKAQDIDPVYEVVPLTKWNGKINRLRKMGKIVKVLQRVAGYLEAAKYWCVVSHVAPPYGQQTFNQYVDKLKQHNYDAGTFKQRMKSGTSLTPDI